jgi:hypothetical protein
MSVARVAAALAVSLALGGCWTNTCEDWYPGTGVPACWEEVDGILWPGPHDGTDHGPSSCGGAYRFAEDCRSLGFTYSCGDAYWVRPEDAGVCGR